MPVTLSSNYKEVFNKETVEKIEELTEYSYELDDILSFLDTYGEDKFEYVEAYLEAVNNIYCDEGEVPCDVAKCENWADKRFGGRSIAIDNAIDVWGDDGLKRDVRRVRICRPCYREWKNSSYQVGKGAKNTFSWTLLRDAMCCH